MEGNSIPYSIEKKLEEYSHEFPTLIQHWNFITPFQDEVLRRLSSQDASVCFLQKVHEGNGSRQCHLDGPTLKALVEEFKKFHLERGAGELQTYIRV